MRNEILFLTLLAMLAEEIDNNEKTISNLKSNLDILAVNPTDYVEIALTATKRVVKFGKLCGNWGIMTTDGGWKSFENVPTCIVEEVAEYVQGVVNKI